LLLSPLESAVEVTYVVNPSRLLKAGLPGPPVALPAVVAPIALRYCRAVLTESTTNPQLAAAIVVVVSVENPDGKVTPEIEPTDPTTFPPTLPVTEPTAPVTLEAAPTFDPTRAIPLAAPGVLPDV
jgi:hypothetical protein